MENPKSRAALEEAVTDMLSSTGQLLRRLRAESNPGALTWSQLAVMARLSRSGPQTTADLARAESVKPQSMGATLAAMEQDGLLQRRPHPTDGRQVLFELTPQAAELRRRHGVLKREWLLTAISQLDPQERQTLIAAAALIRRLADS